MSSDWGSDYSVLLQQVEDGISASSGGASRHHESREGLKRKRLTSDQILEGLEEDSYDKIFKHRASLGEDRLLSAEVDSLKLKVQELTEKLSMEQDARVREKERYTRQLQFMESECNTLKESLTEKTERYFAEKQEWQSKIRIAETKSKSSSASAPEPVLTALRRTEIIDRSDELERRINTLEMDITAKVEELALAKVATARLEAKCCQLDQLVISLRSKLSAETEEESSKQSKKEIASLEAVIREKSKSIERYERKLQQLHLLEQENAYLKTKLSLSAERGETIADLQSKYQMLVTEREEWLLLFRQSLKHAKENNRYSELSLDSHSADKHIPMQVLRLLKKTQELAAVFSNESSELKNELTSCKKNLVRSDEACRELERLLAEANHVQEKHDSRIKLLKQQSQLYEKEVISLRELLKSYDAEFSIGKPKDAEFGLREKDKLIQSLRDQLDEARSQAVICSNEILSLRNTIESTTNSDKLHAPEIKTETPAVVKAEGEHTNALVSNLRSEVETLRFRLREFQRAVGTDYISSETRVLHLKFNPTNNFGKAYTRADSSSPLSKGLAEPGVQEYENINLTSITSEIRQLKEENRRLRDAIILKTDKESQNQTLLPAANTSDGNNTSVNRSTAVDADKLNMRLKAMFKERISCFREAVYLLTGYKIDLFSTDSISGSHPRLKLRSMYAEDPEDCLIFQWRGDSLELLETPYAARIDPKIFSFLTSCHSVPAFLSNITLELFEKQTFLG